MLLSLTWRPVAGGIGRLYKGVAPCLLRSIPANAVMLFTVDKVRQQCRPRAHTAAALCLSSPSPSSDSPAHTPIRFDPSCSDYQPCTAPRRQIQARREWYGSIAPRPAPARAASKVAVYARRAQPMRPLMIMSTCCCCARGHSSSDDGGMERLKQPRSCRRSRSHCAVTKNKTS